MQKKRVREIGGDFDAGANRPYECRQGWGSWPDGFYFRSGRDALKAVAQYAGEQGSGRAWLPALCCESMVAPFASRGISVGYYRLNEKLGADEADLEGKLADGDVLLYMDYFQNPSFSAEQLEGLVKRHPRLITVEDRTHDLLCAKGYVFRPDFVVASLRKWVALADGGGLWSRRMPAVSYEQGEDRFSAYRTLAQREKEDYLQTGEGTAKKDFLAKFKEAERFLDTDPALRPMSDASKKSLQRLHFEKIAARRNGNALTLHEELKGTGIGCLLPKHFCAPLYFPILVKEQERVQREMALADIYCPVIWKIPDQARAVCPVSTRISQAMLAVPFDQRYSKEDMLLVAAALRRIAG